MPLIISIPKEIVEKIKERYSKVYPMKDEKDVKRFLKRLIEDMSEGKIKIIMLKDEE